MPGRITVTAWWDAEARVWVAESADVPGLVAEADTLDSLATQLEFAIRELLELERIEAPCPAIDLVATRSLRLAGRAASLPAPATNDLRRDR